MEPIISIRNLYKSYGLKQVLNNISIDILPGQVIGYIGPNGAGKSTTVKILCGLISDFSGQVMLKGIDIRQKPLAVKSIIGYVFKPGVAVFLWIVWHKFGCTTYVAPPWMASLGPTATIIPGVSWVFIVWVLVKVAPLLMDLA